MSRFTDRPGEVVDTMPGGAGTIRRKNALISKTEGGLSIFGTLISGIPDLRSLVLRQEAD